MKVILIQDLPNLGQRGELKEVAAGFARNYLVPKGIAVEATSGILKEFEANKQILERKYTKEQKAAQEVAGRLEGKVFTIQAKAGEAGKLFGSVTTADLSALLGSAGFIIDKKKIDLSDHIKEVGEYEIQVKLHPEVRAAVKLVVEAEGKEGKAAKVEDAKPVEVKQEAAPSAAADSGAAEEPAADNAAEAEEAAAPAEEAAAETDEAAPADEATPAADAEEDVAEALETEEETKG